MGSIAWLVAFGERFPAIVREAHRVVGGHSAARDIATEAFAKLFRDQGRIENPAGWLKRIGLDHLRSARRRGRRAMGPSSPRTARESPEAARQLSEEP